MEFIFDLIGYWSAVSLVVGASVVGFIIIILIGLDAWIKLVTEGEKTNYILSLLPASWDGGSDIFGVNIFAVLIAVSLFLLIFCGLAYQPDGLCPNNWAGHDHHQTTLLGQYIWLSLKITPITSWVFSVVPVLLGVHFMSKKVYKVSKALDKLEEKGK